MQCNIRRCRFLRKHSLVNKLETCFLDKKCTLCLCACINQVFCATTTIHTQLVQKVLEICFLSMRNSW